MLLSELVQHLDRLLTPELFKDYQPNGLQVAGVDQVQRIVTGVSANQALIDAAIQSNADVLLVHHGFFWRGEEPCITGIRHRRLSALIKNDINLIAYHLPLDGHEKFGNNVQLAKLLDLKITGEFKVLEGPGIGRVGRPKKIMSGDALAYQIEKSLGRTPFYVPGRTETIEQVAWCTGAAQDAIFSAAEAGVDAFITGEISERTVAFAQELGLHFYAAGHHATEIYGVKVLGEYLAHQFKLDHEFIDIKNPI